MNDAERGSATVESIFAVVMLMLLALGALQVAFVLYARNVVMSAAHEGARIVAERGVPLGDAAPVVASVVERSAGGLVSDVSAQAASSSLGRSEIISVRVSGTISAFGPIPIRLPVTATATSTRERLP